MARVIIIFVLMFAAAFPLSAFGASEVQVDGILRINPGGNIVFPDGTTQTTAATPTWSQTLAAGRFVLVLGNTAVLDNETGLVWQRSTDATTYDWVGAFTYCWQLNLGGRKAWRLPSVEELASLVDPAQSNPALPAGHPFTNLTDSYYWTSTTDASGDASVPIYKWSVRFSDGNVAISTQAWSINVRCVRGGK
jgi:hypothetical protein